MSDVLSAEEALKKAIDVTYDCIYDKVSARNTMIVALRALDAAGWQCVPKVATEEMKQAARITDLCDVSVLGSVTESECIQSTLNEFAIAFEAMLAAAPRLVKP